MNSDEERGDLQVQPERPWTAEEEDILFRFAQYKEPHGDWTRLANVLPGRDISRCISHYQHLRDEWERRELEEFKNEFAILHERLKEDIWSQIATEMSTTWQEAESMHWRLGEVQMRRRGTDDSFLTTRMNFPLPQVDEAEVEALREQQQPQERKPGSRWSGDEEAILFACRRAKMTWQQISVHLPGRSASSCQVWYQKQNRSGPAWPQERKNQLCKLYKSLKPNMWAKIGDVLDIPWNCVEDVHWHLGAKEMTERADAALRSQATLGLTPPDPDEDTDDDEVHQQNDEERDQSSHHTITQYPRYQIAPAPIAHDGRPGNSVTVPGIVQFDVDVERLHRLDQRET
ncbi:hypothetical protein E4U17_003994 [Claviceps sp. LM77 group G4]|nr:hypothetical protein E4U17_003994 [Claviceps sp. LM77 group G4]